jgi:hypothetical protein
LRYSLLLQFLAVCVLLASIGPPHALADNSLTVTITVQGLPSGLATNVYVNGNRNGTLTGGASATYILPASAAPYLVSVDSYVAGSNNETRYYCQNTAWQASASGSQVFTYITQYYLDVQTAYSSGTGQGWYTAGSTAQVVVNDQQVPEGQGTRDIFNGWSGDANGTQLTSNPITMDGPKVAVANWETQFYLVVLSDPGNVTGLAGSGWYNSGTPANFSATMIIPISSSTRLKFNRWSGEFTGQATEGSVTMDRPKTVKATYLPQYLLTVVYSPSNLSNSYNETHTGWYDANSQVQLGPAPTAINLSNVERFQFAGWADAGSVVKNLSYTVLVDKPRNITLSYATQYYLEVQSTYGVFSGSGWYDRGAVATITGPTSSGTWPFSYSLTGWSVDPPNEAPTDNNSSWKLVVNGPYVVQAQWSIDYFPVVFLFIGSAAAVTTAAVGGLLGYKRVLRRRSTPQPGKTAPPVVASLGSPCANCGISIPVGALVCEKCGTSVSLNHTSTLEEKVYDYIVNHQGVISLSTASTSLGIPVEELKEITDRLKSEGRLG